MKKLSVAIDGPAGAGKSTIAKKIAEELNINYVDTGAMYRTIALYYINNKVQSTDANRIKETIDNIEIKISFENGEQNNILFGENVNNKIRSQEVGSMASTIAVYKEVREKLVKIQREIAINNNVIMDGRDIGSYVLPSADLKIYLTASVNERANRRYKQLIEKNMKADINEIKNEIQERDNRDMSREFAPLVKAKDAYELDTTNLNIEEVVCKIKKLLEMK